LAYLACAKGIVGVHPPLSYGLRLSGLEHGLVLTVWGLNGWCPRKVLHIPQSGYSYLEEYECANFRRSYMYPTLRYGFSKHFGSLHANLFFYLYFRWRYFSKWVSSLLKGNVTLFI